MIRQMKRDLPLADVVVITGYPSVDTAVSSAGLGVRDYLRKPFTEDEIKTVVHEVFQSRNQGSKEKFLNETREGRLIQKREVIKVLDRTAMDLGFWKELSDDPSAVLGDYQLSSAAKAAIMSGDLRWINEHVGELTQKAIDVHAQAPWSGKSGRRTFSLQKEYFSMASVAQGINGSVMVVGRRNRRDPGFPGSGRTAGSRSIWWKKLRLWEGPWPSWTRRFPTNDCSM